MFAGKFIMNHSLSVKFIFHCGNATCTVENFRFSLIRSGVPTVGESCPSDSHAVILLTILHNHKISPMKIFCYTITLLSAVCQLWRIVLLCLSAVLCPGCTHCGGPPGCDCRETTL